MMFVWAFYDIGMILARVCYAGMIVILRLPGASA